MKVKIASARDLLLWENRMLALVREATLHQGLQLLATRYHLSIVEHHFHAHTLDGPA